MGLRLHWAHHLLLPCDPTSAAQARVFIRRVLNDHDLGHLIDEVQLVASELASSAFVHANTPFTVSAAGNSAFLLVRVRDQSSALPVLPDAAQAGPVTALATARTGGRGLGLVDAFASTWGVDAGRDGSKTVWATFATR
jgi:anti-sigma regulatory factor (Ser/Thr protein kinase)